MAFLTLHYNGMFHRCISFGTPMTVGPQSIILIIVSIMPDTYEFLTNIYKEKEERE
jgi:hypothetical protein